MMPDDPEHICTSCSVPHVDNCPMCWGFGAYEAGEQRGAPVSAGEAIDDRLRGVVLPCQMCGSTNDGVDGRRARAPRGILFVSPTKEDAAQRVLERIGVFPTRHPTIEPDVAPE